MRYQVFSDMDGVLVNFEEGVLSYMNKRLRELRHEPDHPDYKLARSAAVVAKNFGITSKTSQE